MITLVIVVIGFLFFIVGDILIRGGTSIQLNLLLTTETARGESGGIANAIVGSLALVGLALSIAIRLR